MKVDIIGSVGSGKTTLSRKISIDFNVPCYELDNVMWIRSSQGDIRRTEEERESLFKSIINSDSWIIEGSPRKCLKRDLIRPITSYYLTRRLLSDFLEL